MKKKYIIQIGDGQPYPFDGYKVGCEDVYVRIKIDCSEKAEYQTVFDKTQLLLNMKESCIMQIFKIVEIKKKGFLLDYQYIGEPLKNSQKLIQPSFLHSLKEELYAASHIFVQNSIKYEFKLQNIGLDESGKPKIFIGHNFTVASENELKDLLEEYRVQIDKMLEPGSCVHELIKAPSEHTYLSDYSIKLDKKLNQIEDKLRLRGHRYSTSSKDSLSNEKSNKQFRNNNNNNNIVLQSITSKQLTNSFSSRKTTNSIIVGNTMNMPKVHKSSFGDYSTTSYRLNQPKKQDSLTKRVTNALQKTQKAVKIYEQYFRKTRLQKTVKF